MNDKKILLIDDDAEDRSIAAEAIREVDDGVSIQMAESGHEALKLMNAFFDEASLPNLIVLDVNMPKMTGIEVLRVIKSDERFNTIPVIIYSTSINPYEKDRCVNLGAHSYITKPVSYKESIEVASRFLQLCRPAT